MKSFITISRTFAAISFIAGALFAPHAFADEGDEPVIEAFAFANIPLAGLKHMDGELDHMFTQLRLWRNGAQDEDELLKFYNDQVLVFGGCVQTAKEQGLSAFEEGFSNFQNTAIKERADFLNVELDANAIAEIKQEVTANIVADFDARPNQINNWAYMCQEIARRASHLQITMPKDFLTSYESMELADRELLDARASDMLFSLSRAYSGLLDEGGGEAWQALMGFSGRCYVMAVEAGFEEGADFFLHKSLQNPGVNWGVHLPGYGVNMAASYVEKHPDEDNDTAYLCSTYMANIPSDIQ